MTNFRDKIKGIKSSTEARQRRRIPLTDDELGLNDGTSECFLARDQLAHDIELMMNEFVAETPRFAISRGFFEGKYSLSLSCDEHCQDERGEIEKCFSRINFLLAARTDTNRIQITSKLTVLNKDLPKDTAEASLSDKVQMRALTTFTEGQMVRFAEEYFSSRRPLSVAIPETSRN
jgi:hypothetical protein